MPPRSDIGAACCQPNDAGPYRDGSLVFSPTLQSNVLYILIEDGEDQMVFVNPYYSRLIEADESFSQPQT